MVRKFLAALVGAAAMAFAGQASATVMYVLATGDYNDDGSGRWVVDFYYDTDALTLQPTSGTGQTWVGTIESGELESHSNWQTPIDADLAGYALTIYSGPGGLTPYLYSLTFGRFDISYFTNTPLDLSPDQTFSVTGDGWALSRIGNGQAWIGKLSTTAVPEPATWAMMLLGFFGLGAMTRMRRRLLA